MDTTTPNTATTLTADGAAAGATWPPAGWVTNHEAARLLGVSLESMTQSGWKWRSWVIGHARCVRHPVTGGRCNIYRLERLRQIIEARRAAARPAIPDGFVDKDGACRFFGITRFTWKKWVREGKITFGQVIPSPVGARLKLYAVADLERLRQDLFGEDKLYKGADQQWHVPAGFVRRDEAWEQFGVSRITWERWEREGVITCGARVPSGPKLYKVEDINRLLDEYGKYCPPYPDPDRPGVYRVPLSGRGIKRLEAIIDADALPLIDGGTCHIGNSEEGRFVALWSPASVHVPLRRLVMGVRDEAGLNVGHVNGDPLDCRRENLVVRTTAQRSRNARKMSRNSAGQPCSSRFKGVYWATERKAWRARITVDGKARFLGRFDDEIAAAEAYDEAARQWFGEHARLNFPDGVDAFLEAEAAKIAAADHTAAADAAGAEPSRVAA